MRLSAEEARVLGSLIEKQLTTPQQYPLTATALLAACNQTTNRSPVVGYDEPTVLSAFDELKARRLARLVLPSHGRSAVRYRHVVDETLGLDPPQCALLGMLLLRGPQTVGELRLRTERMATFDSLDSLHHELGLLAAAEQPLARRLERRPGQKEDRWECPLVDDAAGPAGPEDLSQARFGEPGGSEGVLPNRWPGVADDLMKDGDGGATAARLGALQAELATLRAELAALRQDLAALRASLGEPA